MKPTAHGIKTAAAAALLAIWISGAALAHPHVFIHGRVGIVFDAKGLAGFDFRWVFDEMFSQMIIGDYDKNRNGRFEPGESEALKAGAFSNLKNFGYFTHIKIAGTPFPVRFVKDFRAEIEKGCLVYRFFVPCHVSAISANKKIAIAVYDQTFYCSIFLAKQPVFYRNQELFEAGHQIVVNKEEAYYFDQIYPEEILLTFRRKS